MGRPIKNVAGDVVVIFALALSIRLIFVWQWLDLPYATVPYLDAISYDQWARNILKGNWLRETAFYQSPLYPYLMAAIYKFLGPNMETISWIQAILGAVTCALLTFTTASHLGRWPGIFAGLLAALNRPLIFYTGPLMKETLGIFLLALFIHFALLARKNQKPWLYLLAGVFLGLTALVRTNVLVLPLALIGWDLWTNRTTYLRNFSFLAVGTLLAILPATIHNWTVSRDFILVNYAGGFNFYIGNSPTALNFVYPEGVSTDPAKEEGDSVRIAEQNLGRKLKPSEVSSFWFDRGWQFLTSSTISNTFAFLLNKLWFFWNDREIGDNYDVHFVSENFKTVLHLPLVGFALLSTFAIFGLVAGWNEAGGVISRRLGAMLFIYMGSVVTFYVTDRYRLPTVLFLIPLAGQGIALLIQGARSFRWKTLRAFATAAPFGVVGFFPADVRQSELDAYNWGVVASLYSDSGNHSRAVEAIIKAIAANAEKAGASAFIKASTSYERLGRLAEAEDLLRRSTETYSNEGQTFFNYGRFKFEHGEVRAAFDLYNKSLSVDPSQHLPYLGLAILHAQSGERALAENAIAQGLARSPNDPHLRALDQMLRDRQKAGGQ